MRKYEESKTTQIMMATVPHVTSGSGLRKFQPDGFLFDRVYVCIVATPYFLYLFPLVYRLTQWQASKITFKSFIFSKTYCHAPFLDHTMRGVIAFQTWEFWSSTTLLLVRRCTNLMQTILLWFYSHKWPLYVSDIYMSIFRSFYIQFVSLQWNNLYIRTPEDGHVNVRNM